MRKEVGRIADSLGVRSKVRHARGRLVDLLNGDTRPAGLRQGSRDNFHFTLLLRFSMRLDSNYLDVGANRGIFLKGLSRLAPLGHHIAYEPVPALCQQLVTAFPNVEVRQAALSDHNGQADFVHVLGRGNQGYSNLAQTSEKKAYSDRIQTEVISVTTHRLDDHVPAGWLPNFVKIDVEGAELQVLCGALKTLRAAKPVISIEHAVNEITSPDVFDLITKDLGLRVFDMEGDGPLDRTEFLDEPGARWNWIAHE